MKNQQGKVIDVRDFLAVLLESWRKILLFLLIITLLAAGYGATKAYKAYRADKEKEILDQEELEEMNQDAVELAKQDLTTDEIAEVDRINNQLKSYVDYRNLLQEDFDNYLQVSAESDEQMMVRRVTFSLSSNMEGAENIFVNLALGVDEYTKLMEILPHADTLTAAYNCIYMNTLSGNETQVLNLPSQGAEMPAQYLINVEMVGDSREICDRMWEEVVGPAFEREAETLRGIDPDAELKIVDTQYQANMANYITGKQQSTFDMIQKVDNTINNIRNSYIEKLSSKQKKYYSLIHDSELANPPEPEEEEAVEEEVKKRYYDPKVIGLGLVLGLCLSVLYILIRYLISDRINVGREMETYYHISLLDVFYLSAKKTDFLTKWIRALRGANFERNHIKADLVATDVTRLLDKEGTKSVYLINTNMRQDDADTAGKIRDALLRIDPNCVVSYGDPLDDVDALNSLTQHKNAVMIVHAKRTALQDIDKLLDQCSRHQVKILGAVAIVKT